MSRASRRFAIIVSCIAVLMILPAIGWLILSFRHERDYRLMNESFDRVATAVMAELDQRKVRPQSLEMEDSRIPQILASGNAPRVATNTLLLGPAGIVPKRPPVLPNGRPSGFTADSLYYTGRTTDGTTISVHAQKRGSGTILGVSHGRDRVASSVLLDDVVRRLVPAPTP